MRTLGRYELLRPLARGGMAEVYLARRRVAGVEKRLVIKRLRRERTADPRFLDLFVKEAQLSMSLVQQNIVPVFDFGRAGDDVFLAMEHIDGKDLGSSLAQARGAAMPPLVAAFVAAECCHALDYAHRAHHDARRGGGSVVHRDVTPRNVLLSWAGEVKLADFGIAAAMGGGEGALAGTPGYMAPEQARGEALDARADLYSLGLVLWEMLLGARVRAGGERGELLEAARTNQLPPLPDDLAPELAAILRAATAAEPSARVPSAQAMADQLDAFMVAERARTAGAPPARQLASWLAARWADARDEAEAAEAADAAEARRASRAAVHVAVDGAVTPLAAIEDGFGTDASGAEGGAGGAAVTFLDDGAASVLGSETMRSMAVTAPPESSSTSSSGASGQGAPAVVEAPRSDAPSDASARVDEKRAPARHGPEPSAADPAPPVRSGPASPRRAGRGLALVGAALIAGLGSVVVYRALLSDRPIAPSSGASPAPRILAEPAPPSRASPPATPSPDDASPSIPAPAAPSPAPAPSVAASAPSSPPSSPPRASPPAVVASSTSAPSSSPSTASPRPRTPPSAPSSSPPPPATPPLGAPSTARRAFTIGARPWANFTIDGGEQRYETPATVELPLGSHRIRFENPTLGVVQEVTIVVTADGPASHLQKLQ